MKADPECVSTAVRSRDDLPQSLTHHGHLVGQLDVLPDEDEAGPVGWVLEVLGCLHRRHCFSQSTTGPGSLEKRGVERFHDQLDRSVGHRPEGDHHALRAGGQESSTEADDTVGGGAAVPVLGVAGGEDDQPGGQLEVEQVGRREQEVGEAWQLNGGCLGSNVLLLMSRGVDVIYAYLDKWRRTGSFLCLFLTVL